MGRDRLSEANKGLGVKGGCRPQVASYQRQKPRAGQTPGHTLFQDLQQRSQDRIHTEARCDQTGGVTMYGGSQCVVGVTACGGVGCVVGWGQVCGVVTVCDGVTQCGCVEVDVWVCLRMCTCVCACMWGWGGCRHAGGIGR